MEIKEIEAKTILLKHKVIDSWFISSYGMNLYRGCSHNCSYCDGRSEKYQVTGDFGREISVKINAPEIVNRELDPVRKRKPMKGCYIMLGGGVSDSYQPIEKKYGITRKILEVIDKYALPVSILTKSPLIERDIDLLKRINEKAKVIVSFSFSSVDSRLSAILEPGVAPPEKRLKTMEILKSEGIAVGMFLMPVIPFLTDTPDMIDQSCRSAKDTGTDFIIFGGMTLKPGKQMEHFYKTLNNHYPELIQKYRNIYTGFQWGGADNDYVDSLHQTFNEISKQFKIPRRIPPRLFKDLLNENDYVAVLLDQLDYLCKLEGLNSPYGSAARSIRSLDKPLSEIKHSLTQLNGIGKVTEKIIKEIMENGTSSYYEKLI